MHQGSGLWLVTTAISILFAASSVGTFASAREIVVAPSGCSAGTIVIRTSERRLYYYLGDGRAIRYPVGVGRAGMQWAGFSHIDGKYRYPDWSPPASIRKDYSAHMWPRPPGAGGLEKRSGPALCGERAG
jgi:lipoprotein-anchoring transpeptidase ErfK/SrfK